MLNFSIISKTYSSDMIIAQAKTKESVCAGGLLQHNKVFFCLFALHATPDSLGLDNWGTWRRC